MNAGSTELIMDVGSASIGVCIASGKKNENPTLSMVQRVPIGIESGEARSGIQNRALETIKKAVQGIKGAPPKKLRVILAAPWYSAAIKTIQSEARKPARITDATVAHAVSVYRAQGEKTDTGSGRVRVESVVSQVTVNGYPTSLAEPVEGTTLKINLYESESDEQFIQGLREILVRAFPGAEISYHTFPLVSFVVLRALRDEKSFVFADIGGEITDVAIVHRDSLSFVGSFPEGVLSFARRVSGKGSIANTLSRLTLFVKNELSNDESNAFGMLFTASAGYWKTAYQKLLEAAVSDVPIPQTTFLAGDKDELEWFKKILTSTPEAFPVRPILITPDFFHGAIMLGEGALYDSFLSIGALFFHMKQNDLIEV